MASLAVAARDNGFTGKERKRITRACAAEYRETMLAQAERGNLAVWYSHVEPSTELVDLRDELDSSMKKRTRKLIEKSMHRDSVQALGKLTTVVDGGNAGSSAHHRSSSRSRRSSRISTPN